MPGSAGYSDGLRYPQALSSATLKRQDCSAKARHRRLSPAGRGRVRIVQGFDGATPASGLGPATPTSHRERSSAVKILGPTVGVCFPVSCALPTGGSGSAFITQPRPINGISDAMHTQDFAIDGDASAIHGPLTAGHAIIPGSTSADASGGRSGNPVLVGGTNGVNGNAGSDDSLPFATGVTVRFAIAGAQHAGGGGIEILIRLRKSDRLGMRRHRDRRCRRQPAR